MAEVKMTLERAIAAERSLVDDLERVGPEAEAVYATRDVLAYVTLARKALEQEAKPVPVGDKQLGQVSYERWLITAFGSLAAYHDEWTEVEPPFQRAWAVVEREAYERGKAETEARLLAAHRGYIRELELERAAHQETEEQLEATIANAGTIADVDERRRVKEMERRDWDVRVLDAWRAAAATPRKRAYEFDEHGHLYICEWQPFARMGQIRDKYEGFPDAVRHAAALAVLPTLDAATRAELGECP